MCRQMIVVTDLDGTLLDHHDYRFDAAKPALHRLRSLGIPLILNSSKTAAELLVLRHQLDNHEPFIVENGAGLFVPRSEVAKTGKDESLERVAFGMPRQALLDELHNLREIGRYHFRGFADISDAELAAWTGLNLDAARMARQRDFSEPILWQDSDARFAAFRAALQARGITAQRGGRFIHLAASGDKARPIPWLRDWYGKRLGGPPRVVALGDADNDVALLEAADIAVLVSSPAHPPPPVQHPRLIQTREHGPTGWNSALLAVLADCDPDRRHVVDKE